MAFPHLLNQLFQSNGTSTKLKAEVLPDSYLSTSGGTVNGNITLTGTLTGKVVSASSDKRLKENITDYDADISGLSSHKFRIKTDKGYFSYDFPFDKVVFDIRKNPILLDILKNEIKPNVNLNMEFI